MIGVPVVIVEPRSGRQALPTVLHRMEDRFGAYALAKPGGA